MSSVSAPGVDDQVPLIRTGSHGAVTHWTFWSAKKVLLERLDSKTNAAKKPLLPMYAPPRPGSAGESAASVASGVGSFASTAPQPTRDETRNRVDRSLRMRDAWSTTHATASCAPRTRRRARECKSCVIGEASFAFQATLAFIQAQ